MERFSLKQIETFYCVARSGSFQSAAAQLNTTQPAISSRVRELEAALGVQLFDRSGRQARLTARGRELVSYAQRLLALAADIREHIGTPEALAGVVRLGIADTIALTWLPELLTRLAQRFPGVAVELEIDLSVNLLRLLSERHVDIAFLVGPVPGPHHTSEPLARVELAWMASGRLPLPPEPLSPVDLVSVPIITHNRGSHQHVMVQQWFRSQDAEPRRLSFCSSLATIIQLTISGFGLSVLPVHAMTKQIDSGELRIVDVGAPLPPNDFMTAYPVDARDAPVRLIAEMATEIARAHPAFVSVP
jgi:DNA-binding transcriptional LysR family regulator